jgi:MinD-like ATPase involved in chromosome partitioning or flagellar assembly
VSLQKPDGSIHDGKNANYTTSAVILALLRNGNAEHKPIVHQVVSDGPLVVRSNNEGVPFVLANPDAPVSRDIAKVAAGLIGAGALPVGAGRH